MDAGEQFQLGQRAAERYEAFVGLFMTPFVHALIEATDVQPGDVVLDVACGTGFVTRAVAGRLGPDDRVVGTDINPAMLAIAGRAVGDTVPKVEWRQAPADDLPFDDGSFDVVLCQQGLQFVPDLPAALAEVARLLRPGGRFGTTTWASLDRSPYMAAQYHALTEALGAGATESFLGAFSMTAERLRSAAEFAGLTMIDVQDVERPIRLPALPGTAADHLTALPWGQALVESGADALAAAAAAITSRLRSHAAADGVITVPFASLLLTAVRPG